MEKFATFIVALIVVIGIDAAISVLAAQLAVFGLSYMHVNTGLDGPWLILMAISIIVSVNKSSK